MRGSGLLCGRRLLLGHAVESAEAEDEVAAGDADDFAIGEKFGESVEGDAVVRIVEGGDDDDFVGDVKICVAGGEALAIEIDWARAWEAFRRVADGRPDRACFLASERFSWSGA